MKHTGLSDPALQLCRRSMHHSFLQEGRSVLDLEVQLPEAPGALFLNQYYRRFCRCLFRYCAERLIPVLPEDAQPLQLILEYRIRLLTASLLSLTLELHRRDLSTRPAAQFASVWSRESGMLLTLRSFFPGCPFYRRRVNEWLRREALARLDSGYCLYDPAQAERAGRLFRAQNFYAAEKGLVQFFPALTLGSAAEGIPEFCLPWNSLSMGKLRLPHLPEDSGNAILWHEQVTGAAGTLPHDR